MDHDNPTFGFFKSSYEIPHYYGDTVRWLFLAAAALLFLSLPVFPELLPFTPLVQVASAVVLVIFAALTNPLKRWVMVGDAVVAGIAVLVIEMIAIENYRTDTQILFMLREGLVIAFLFALYFSLKTVRAMAQHMIGKKGVHLDS